MKMIGNEVHIQRGETWSLDFAVTNDKGHPFVVLKNWPNPYLAITVTAALYEQLGDFRETYWLDLNRRYVEQADGSMVLSDLKRFTSAEVLWLPNGFYVSDVLSYYGTENGGKIVLDGSSDFDIKNFLFYVDPDSDGNYQYKYVKNYTTDENGSIELDDNGYELVEWEDYDFRIIKQFMTKNWMEQGYLFDVKVLAGESVQEHLKGILDTQNVTTKPFTEWTNEDWDTYIEAIEDKEVRVEMRQHYDDGAPLMPTYDTKSLLLEPTPIYVSVNIQGGVR
jgi:hypothetical protein